MQIKELLTGQDLLTLGEKASVRLSRQGQPEFSRVRNRLRDRAMRRYDPVRGRGSAGQDESRRNRRMPDPSRGDPSQPAVNIDFLAR